MQFWLTRVCYIVFVMKRRLEITWSSLQKTTAKLILALWRVLMFMIPLKMVYIPVPKEE